MDIFSHGMYSIALNETLDTKKFSAGNIRAAFFWGIMPDLIAFGPSFAIGILNRTFDHHSTFFGHDIASILYAITHSFVIFGFALLVASIIKRKLYIPMLGWGLHVIMDIPTHLPEFATPFLYPISDYTLPVGISWRSLPVWTAIFLYGAMWLILAMRRKARLSAKPIPLRADE